MYWDGRSFGWDLDERPFMHQQREVEDSLAYSFLGIFGNTNKSNQNFGGYICHVCPSFFFVFKPILSYIFLKGVFKVLI